MAGQGRAGQGRAGDWLARWLAGWLKLSPCKISTEA